MATLMASTSSLKAKVCMNSRPAVSDQYFLLRGTMGTPGSSSSMVEQRLLLGFGGQAVATMRTRLGSNTVSLWVVLTYDWLSHI